MPSVYVGRLPVSGRAKSGKEDEKKMAAKSNAEEVPEG